MQKEDARILVIGAGVNGSLCATRLYQAGCDVTVLARGKWYEEIRDAGIIIEDPIRNAPAKYHKEVSVPTSRRDD